MESEKEKLSPELRLKVLKATAVQQAVAEVLNEQRQEVIRRAAAKLRALGVTVTENEIG